MSASGSDSAPASSEKPGASDTQIQLEQKATSASDLFQIPPEYEYLRDKVTCHRCKDFQPGYVYVCSHSHAFCRHCHVTCRGVCPFVEDKEKGPCKSPLQPAKSRHHDTVFEASTFKCIYAEHGCTEKVPGTYYTLHMASCPFRPGPKGVPAKTSELNKVYRVVKRVTPEYTEEHKELAPITWTPELQKIMEEQYKPRKPSAGFQALFPN